MKKLLFVLLVGFVPVFAQANCTHLARDYNAFMACMQDRSDALGQRIERSDPRGKTSPFPDAVTRQPQCRFAPSCEEAGPFDYFCWKKIEMPPD